MINYFNRLLIMNLLVKDVDDMIVNLENLKYYQDKYFQKDVIKEIENLIKDNDKIKIIGPSYKEKLYDYLDFFRDLNTTIKKDDKSEILKLINNALILLEKINVYEEDKFYERELNIRTFGYYDSKIEKLPYNDILKSKINKSISLDLYYYENLIGMKKDNKQINFEYFIWSIGKYISDYPEILKDPTIFSKISFLLKREKINWINLLNENSFKKSKRIIYENKQITKIMR